MMPCPRREEISVLFRMMEAEEDHWRDAGPNKVCSFCGSLSPEDFGTIVERTIAGVEGYGVETSTKGYKLYLKQPGVVGNRKFYLQHTKGQSQEWVDQMTVDLNRAIKITYEQFMALVTGTDKRKEKR